MADKKKRRPVHVVVKKKGGVVIKPRSPQKRRNKMTMPGESDSDFVQKVMQGVRRARKPKSR